MFAARSGISDTVQYMIQLTGSSSDEYTDVVFSHACPGLHCTKPDNAKVNKIATCEDRVELNVCYKV